MANYYLDQNPRNGCTWAEDTVCEVWWTKESDERQVKVKNRGDELCGSGCGFIVPLQRR